MSEFGGEFEDLFEQAPCGYLVLAADGRIGRANRTLCEWLGRTPSELNGKHPHVLLTIAGRIFYETHIAPLLRMQGYFHEIALDLISQSGEIIPVIANAVEHRDTEGRAKFTRVAFLKAADRRRYEHELLNARDMAREALRTERTLAELREQFIAVLGHDLRNPLASLSAGTRLLLRDPRSESEMRILNMMQSTVFRMAGLIDNVLDLARARLGGGLALDRKDVELRPILHHVADELRTAWAGSIIEEHYSLQRPVNVDPIRIGQLVSNLLANALTHGSSNQPVQLEAGTADDALEISVTNLGNPIPPAAREKLFKPFFRGDVRASKQGLGLGLYIASQIAQAHNASLNVQSLELETRFTFRMPIARPAL
jgi:sigma-B regulation protein RsbU (phosphoserine phosphatase)